MDNSTYVAIASTTARQRALAISANNLANANTAGFKSEHGLFEQYVNKAKSDPSELGKTSFVIDSGTYIDATQGGLTSTGNPLDIALQGDGWLSYGIEGGQTAYGRDGRMVINSLGDLTTLDGRSILDAGGAPIAIPPDVASLAIGSDGSISDQDGNVIAQLGIFDIPDIRAYTPIGSGMWSSKDVADGAPAPMPSLNTSVMQGFTESSNVKPISEMIGMMSIQNAYDQAIKVMENENELSKQVLSRLGRR